MQTNKYDKQTTFIGIKTDFGGGLQTKANPPGNYRNRHKPIGIYRNLIKS